MDTLLFLLYEALASLLPFLLLLRRKKRRLDGKPSPGAAVLLFGLYLTAVFHFTGAGTLWELLRCQELRPEQINLLPFSHTIDPAAYGQNVLLLLPLGFLLPFLGRSFCKPFPTLLAGFSLSLLVEVSQLWNNRRTDIDDLLLNTLGAVLGWLLWRLLGRGRGAEAPSGFPFLAAAVLFAGRFLLYHEMGLARLLYGF